MRRRNASHGSMELSQCIEIIEKVIAKYLPLYHYTRLQLLYDFLLFFKDNCYLQYIGSKSIIIARQIVGIGTGYSHSSGLANLVLLSLELLNQLDYYQLIQNGKLINIVLFKRYIDDIKIIIDINVDEFRNEVDINIFII